MLTEEKIDIARDVKFVEGCRIKEELKDDGPLIEGLENVDINLPCEI